jgi:replication-associated recombination protein RarA
MSKLISEMLRPTSFDELVISNEIRSRLIKMQESGNVLNMLFHGKPGSGKTSAAKIFVDCDNFDVITINGSLETSVEDVRLTIRNFCSSVSLFGKQKIVFIDEADFLSKNAQAGLRKVIEDYSENARFIFTANEIKKMHPALCSRLLLVNFDMTSSQIMQSLSLYKERVFKILSTKYQSVDENRINRIIDMNFPDYRSIANHLEFEFI